MNQSIDYPSSVNSASLGTREHIGHRHDQGLLPVFESSALLLKAGDSQTVLDTYGAPEHDRSIVHRSLFIFFNCSFS
jgi:hypothetical protein